jgi:hypothetical protein
VQALVSRSALEVIAKPEPFWHRLFRKSIVEFASEELESGYQSYLANHAGDYVVGYTPIFVLAWAQLFHCIAVNGADPWANPPPGLALSVLLYLLPGAALISFLWLQKKQYSQNWRGINFTFMAVHIFHQNALHMLSMWQQSCINRGRCQIFKSSGTLSSLNAFALENFYLTLICLRILVMSAGQAPDFFFTTLGLFHSMAGNRALCAADIWGPERVTLAPPLAAVSRKGSALLLGAVSPHAAWLLPGELSCPATLGFWQVVGWLAGCLVIIGRDIISRRWYLQSAAQPLGPAAAARAKTWPFGDAAVMHRLAVAVLAVVWGAGLLLSVALPLLQ